MPEQFKYSPQSEPNKPKSFRYCPNGSSPARGRWLSVHEPIYQDKVETMCPFQQTLSSTGATLVPAPDTQEFVPLRPPPKSKEQINGWTIALWIVVILCVLALVYTLLSSGVLNTSSLNFEHSIAYAAGNIYLSTVTVTSVRDTVTPTIALTPSAPVTITSLTKEVIASVTASPSLTASGSPTPSPSITPIPKPTGILITTTPILSAAPIPSQVSTLSVTPSPFWRATKTSTPSVTPSPTMIVPSVMDWLITTPLGIGMMCIIISLQLVTLIVILTLPLRLNNIKTHILERDTMPTPSRSLQSNKQVSEQDKPVSPPIIQSELGQEPMPLLLHGFQVSITRPKTKNGENQDAEICGLTNDRRYRLVAVADGVGMAKNSSVASETIVTVFGEHIGRLQATAQIPMENEMRKFYSLATLRMKQRLEQEKLPLDSAATTFIGLVESSSRYVLTYLADGSVYQITQSNDGYNISAVQRLLTSASPDVPPQIGATGKSDEPSIEIYAKGTLEGSMWIVATDGLNDLERYLDDGKTKVSGPKAAEHLADEIWQSFRESPSRFDEKTIEAVLWRWLKKCQSTDDATIAILISGEMYAHWQKLVVQSKTGRLH